MAKYEWLENLPSDLKVFLNSVKERIQNIQLSYGSLQKYGKPPIQTKEELATIYYIVKNIASYRELAKYFGIQHVSVYRWIKSIEQKHRFNFDGKIEEITPEELIELAKELITPKARKWIKSVRDSAVIQEFINNPVKRHKSSKHGMYYTKSQVNATVKAVNDLAVFIEKNKDIIRRLAKTEPTNNPDLWTEDFIRIVIDIYCASKTQDSFKQLVCKRRIKQLLRRIKKWAEWFNGEIGTVRNVVRPKESTLFLEHYLKLKKIALESNDNELKAFFTIVGLHIWSGAREGWGSLSNKLQRLQMQGIKLKVKGIGDIDLDDEIVDSSLIGIKWSKAKWSAEGKLIGFEIYEEKTKKYWNLSINWLDEDLTKILQEVYEKVARPKNIDSVVKSILLYYGVKPPTGNKWTVAQFKKWYKKQIAQLKELLKLPWPMTPHRLRSAHIAILAELRIPMEIALGNTGFGVGWDDASTALIFYLRFSKTLLRDYIQQAEEIKKRIAEQIA